MSIIFLPVLYVYASHRVRISMWIEGIIATGSPPKTPTPKPKPEILPATESLSVVGAAQELPWQRKLFGFRPCQVSISCPPALSQGFPLDFPGLLEPSICL